MIKLLIIAYLITAVWMHGYTFGWSYYQLSSSDRLERFIGSTFYSLLWLPINLWVLAYDYIFSPLINFFRK